MNGALILKDGSIFLGKFFGYPCQTEGEVVFSTGMVGYPQSLTDPSYTGQILVFTYPLIGNYGVPKLKYKDKIIQNFESEKIHVRGLIVSSLIDDISHWQADRSLDDWLKLNKIPALADIDTRELTQKIRQKGVMLGRISRIPIKNKKISDPNQENLANLVSCDRPIIYKNGKKTILLIDCGVKAGILRELYKLGLTIIRVPWNWDSSKLKVDGVVISNGPGDPKKLIEAIKTIKFFMKAKLPILGICLGNQLLALASGADTYKLKYGHRSANQPVRLGRTKKAYITSQNHGYAISQASLSQDWQEWFINLNDKTNEGIRHKKLPFLAVQFHPEGNPGPTDTGWIFEEFVKKL